jgi:hypothetical protein
LALIGYTDRRESRVACLIRTRLKSRGWWCSFSFLS